MIRRGKVRNCLAGWRGGNLVDRNGAKPISRQAIRSSDIHSLRKCSSLTRLDCVLYSLLYLGALLGALIGDCLGAYWERMSWKGTHPLDKVSATTQLLALASIYITKIKFFVLFSSLGVCRIRDVGNSLISNKIRVGL